MPASSSAFRVLKQVANANTSDQPVILGRPLIAGPRYVRCRGVSSPDFQPGGGLPGEEMWSEVGWTAPCSDPAEPGVAGGVRTSPASVIAHPFLRTWMDRHRMIRSVQGKSCPACLGQRTGFHAETNGCTFNRCNDCTTLFQIHEMRCRYRNTERCYASELEYRPDRDVTTESIPGNRHLYALVGKHSTADIPRLLDVGAGDDPPTRHPLAAGPVCRPRQACPARACGGADGHDIGASLLSSQPRNGRDRTTSPSTSGTASASSGCAAAGGSVPARVPCPGCPSSPPGGAG